MDNNSYQVYRIMEQLKRGASKKDVQGKCALEPKDFDKAWKALKGMNRIVTTRRKRFVLNGTVLAARMHLAGRLIEK